MARRNRWGEQHPRISLYCDSREEHERLEEEAARNGLKLADYLKHIISSRDAILRVRQGAARTAGHGVHCYNCNNTLPWDYIEAQRRLQEAATEQGDGQSTPEYAAAR